MSYTQQELLEIYQRAYIHRVKTLVKDHEEHERPDVLVDTATFAYWIARDPLGETAQQMANDVVSHMEYVHTEMMDEIHTGEHRVYPCVCIYEDIKKRADELEALLAEVEENTPESDALINEFNRWYEYASEVGNGF